MKRPVVAFIAHDSKKEEMVDLVRNYKQELDEVDIIATRSTGQMIISRVGLPVTLVQSGAQGGDMQIGAMITNDEISVVVFLRDPYTVFPDEPVLTSLLRVCDIHEVPMATNITTANAVLRQLFMCPGVGKERRVVADYLDEIAVVHE